MTHKEALEKRMEHRVKHYVTKTVKVLAIIVFASVLFALAVYVLMRLWNWLMPDLFGLATLNYWQALGIMVLAKLIFGFGGGSSNKGRHKTKTKGHVKKDAKCGAMRRDFSEWKLYDEFWSTEGEAAFQAYVERKKSGDAKEDEEKAQS